jgi:tetratricopeptide (TPR) repeat protein
VALSLNCVGMALEMLGRPAEALPRFENQLAMFQRLKQGEDHRDMAASLNSVGELLRVLGRSAEALPKYEEALAMRQRLAKGGDGADVAWSLNNLGTVLNDLGRPADALPKHTEALAMRQRLFAGDHREVALSLNNVGVTLNELGRAGEALSKCDAALAMSRRLSAGKDDSDVAMRLSNVAGTLHSLGRPAEALPMLKEALAMLQRLGKEKDQPDIALVLNNVAAVLAALDQRSDALAGSQDALEMRKRLFKGADHPDVVISLNNVAVLLRAFDRAGEALLMLKEALAMSRRLSQGKDHPNVALTLLNVGATLAELGRMREALPELEDAFAMSQRLRIPTYSVTTVLGMIQLQLGRPDNAAEFFDEAIVSLEHSRRDVGGDELDRAGFFAQISSQWQAFDGMVEAQLKLRRSDKALEYLERGRARGLLDVVERGQYLQGKDLLGPVEGTARASKDKRLLDEVLAVRQRMRNAESSIAQRTAELSLTRGRRDLTEEQKESDVNRLLLKLDEAQEAYQRERRAALNLLGAKVSFDFRPRTAKELQAVPSGQERLLVYSISAQKGLVFVVPPVGGSIRAEELFWPDGAKVTERSVRKEVIAYVDGIETEGQLATAARTRRQLATATSDGQTTFDPLLQLARGQRLLRTLVPSGVWMEIKKSPRVYLAPDRLLQRLPFEALVVSVGKAPSYWLDEGPGVVYGSSATVLLGRREARAEQHKRREQGSSLERTAVVLGDPIYERESKGHEPPPGQGVRVSAVAEGSLAERLGIQAGAVITSYGDKAVRSVKELDEVLKPLFLAERMGQLKETPRFRVWQSGAVFEREVPPGQALGVQLVELASAQIAVERSGYLSRYGPLRPLPWTRKEAQDIYAALSGKPYQDAVQDPLVPVLLGKDATRSRLWELAPSSRFVHLATHGLINDESKVSYSSLALTVPEVPTAEDYGFLTLLDLFDHWWGRLRDVELVVLSACETQRGVIQSQEAVYGLPWGFMYAGSPAVIASLWQVDDKSTAQMMGSLYRSLRNGSEARVGAPSGGDKMSAFLEARKQLKEDYPEPYFWAPFIYLGEPN